MTPGQLVSYLDRLKGVEAQGEETQWKNGAQVPLLRYNKNRTSQVMNTESFVFVDKETGLPLSRTVW